MHATTASANSKVLHSAFKVGWETEGDIDAITCCRLTWALSTGQGLAEATGFLAPAIGLHPALTAGPPRSLHTQVQALFVSVHLKVQVTASFQPSSMQRVPAEM